MSAASSHRLELKIGLLIVAGLVATVALILVSDRFSFDDYYRVNAFLKDAGGLRNGSPVTLAGLPIGKVEAISADSGKARHPIKVTMAIKETYRLPRSSTLTIATSGIFGDSYLAFSGSGSPGNASDLLPLDGTAEVIATSGFFDTATQEALALLANVNDLLGPESRTDAKALLRNSARLAGEGVELVKALRTQITAAEGALAHLDALGKDLVASNRALTARADAALVSIDRLAQRGDVVLGTADRALVRLDDALADGNELLAATAPDLRVLASELRGVAARTGALLAGIQQGRGVVGQLLSNQDLAKDVNDLAINLSQASELIAEHPEALVFGQGAQQSMALRERRERLRMRRAFQEGYFQSPLTVPVPEPTLLQSAREAAPAK